MREFSGNVLEIHGKQKISLKNLCERQFQEVYLLRTGKMFPSIYGNTFPAQKNV
jgi:hypothetical protein